MIRDGALTMFKRFLKWLQKDTDVEVKDKNIVWSNKTVMDELKDIDPTIHALKELKRNCHLFNSAGLHTFEQTIGDAMLTVAFLENETSQELLTSVITSCKTKIRNIHRERPAMYSNVTNWQINTTDAFNILAGSPDFNVTELTKFVERELDKIYKHDKETKEDLPNHIKQMILEYKLELLKISKKLSSLVADPTIEEKKNILVRVNLRNKRRCNG